MSLTQEPQPETSTEQLQAKIIELLNQLSGNKLKELHQLIQRGAFPDKITQGNVDYDLAEADIITTLYPDDLIRLHETALQTFLHNNIRLTPKLTVSYDSPRSSQRFPTLLGNPGVDEIKTTTSDARYFTQEAIAVMQTAMQTGQKQGRYINFPEDTPPVFRLNTRFRQYIPSSWFWGAMAMLKIAPLEHTLEHKLYHLLDVGGVETGFFSLAKLVKSAAGKITLRIYIESIEETISIGLSGGKITIETKDQVKLQKIMQGLSRKYSLSRGEEDVLTTAENIQFLLQPLLLTLSDGD